MREKFNERRQVILKQCESVVPILTRRYQAFIPLFQMCEKHDAWNSDFESYHIDNSPPPAWAPVEPRHVDISGEMDHELVEGHDLRRFNGGTINTNAGFYVIVDFTAVHDGIARFTSGTTAFEKVMGATEIEHSLPQIITAATNYDTINTSVLMRQFRNRFSNHRPGCNHRDFGPSNNLWSNITLKLTRVVLRNFYKLNRLAYIRSLLPGRKGILLSKGSDILK